MKKIAIIVSHPIQYYVPLFQALAKNKLFQVKVFYTWGEISINKFDPGFNKYIEWDLPLLDGYDYEFLNNVSNDPGTHHFSGIINPDIIMKISEFSPNKILVFGWSFQSHLKVLRYFKNKVPIYFRGDSHLLNKTNFFKHLLRKLFLHWVYSHVDYAIYVGTNNRDYYLEMGLKVNQLLFAPHAIDNLRFDKLSEKDESNLKDFNDILNIPKDYLKLIYIGKYESRKNIVSLLRIKLELKDKKIALILIGNGNDEEELKKLAKGDDNVHFFDFMNQSLMPIAYRLGDVFILPSRIETWGLAINEAMSSGLAIIASDKVGSAIDLVKGNGYIFRSEDFNDLKAKIISIEENREMLKVFKLKSKEIIKEWSMGILISKFEKILSDEL